MINTNMFQTVLSVNNDVRGATVIAVPYKYVYMRQHVVYRYHIILLCIRLENQKFF